MLRMANLKVIARKALLVQEVMILASFVVYVRRYRQNLPICEL